MDEEKKDIIELLFSIGTPSHKKEKKDTIELPFSSYRDSQSWTVRTT